jgi:hypothetical protein
VRRRRRRRRKKRSRSRKRGRGRKQGMRFKETEIRNKLEEESEGYERACNHARKQRRKKEGGWSLNSCPEEGER